MGKKKLLKRIKKLENINKWYFDLMIEMFNNACLREAKKYLEYLKSNKKLSLTTNVANGEEEIVDEN